MKSVRRHRTLLVAFTLVLIGGALLLAFATRITPHVRDRAVTALNQRFRSEVDLESLQVSVFPRPELSGTGLTMRHNSRTDVPPLAARDSCCQDGTNGDTWLERVEARLIDTRIVARGAVVRAEDVKGRRISLDVAIDDGRIEDVLRHPGTDQHAEPAREGQRGGRRGAQRRVAPLGNVHVARGDADLLGSVVQHSRRNRPDRRDVRSET